MPGGGELAEYAARSRDLIEDAPQMDEENTKRKLVEPLLEVLGWDMLSPAVELEYSVQIGRGTTRVDYALKLEETPVVFVEAKGVDTTLNTDHQQQLRSYMRQVGVDWGLLTNGQAFELMRRDTSSDQPKEITLAEFTVAEIEDHEHALKAISRKSIDSGEAEQIATKLEAVQAAVRTLHEDKEAIAEAVTGVVTERTGDAVAQQVEREAKTFVDQLRNSLADQAAVDEDGPPESRGADDSDPAEPHESSGYTIRVLEDGHERTRVSGATQVDAMEALVAELIDHADLLDTISLPYVPGSGRGDRALLNVNPEHTEGSEMHQYRQLSDDLYLFTNLSKDAKQRYCTELAEQVGLSCAYTGDW